MLFESLFLTQKRRMFPLYAFASVETSFLCSKQFRCRAGRAHGILFYGCETAFTACVAVRRTEVKPPSIAADVFGRKQSPKLSCSAPSWVKRLCQLMLLCSQGASAFLSVSKTPSSCLHRKRGSGETP